MAVVRPLHMQVGCGSNGDAVNNAESTAKYDLIEAQTLIR